MTSKIFAAALAALLLSAPARAEDAKPEPSAKQSVLTFFKHLRESLAASAVQGERKKGRVGAVAAVRGADQKSALADPDVPTLKGDLRAKREKAAAAEDAEFAAAVDLILKGQTDEGVKALEAFKVKHPKSRNLDNVQEAIEKAKTMSAAPKADAPKDDGKKADEKAGAKE